MKIKTKQKNNQKDYTKTMSISRNCQSGVRLARPTHPVFFGGQSVEFSGGCFFWGGSLSDFLGGVFFLFFFCFFSVFFSFFFEKKTEKKTKQKNRKKRGRQKKKGSPPTPETRAASRRTPTHSALEKFGACWNHTLQHTSLRSLLVRLVFSTCSSSALCFFVLFLFSSCFFVLFLFSSCFFCFVFIFILFFQFVSFLFFICFFYLFWNSSKLELWFS